MNVDDYVAYLLSLDEWKVKMRNNSEQQMKTKTKVNMSDFTEGIMRRNEKALNILQNR